MDRRLLDGVTHEVLARRRRVAQRHRHALGHPRDRRPQRWAARDELRLAIITWIEKTHHRRRRQARLGRTTPIEFETIHVANTLSLAA
jgi:transposase InsO family protein